MALKFYTSVAKGLGAKSYVCRSYSGKTGRWAFLPAHLILNRVNGVYSRNNLSKIKDEAYITILDQYESIETHWIVLYVNDEDVTYFDSIGVEHIPKEI